MAEDPVETKEAKSPESPPTTSPEAPGRKISRRQFLRYGGAAGLGLGAAALGLYKESQRGSLTWGGEKARAQEALEQLGVAGLESEWILEVLEDANKAEANLAALNASPQRQELAGLVRKRFPNPDINAEKQIFFVTDHAALQQLLSQISRINWRKEREFQLDAILNKGVRASKHGSEITNTHLITSYGRMDSLTGPGSVDLIPLDPSERDFAEFKREHKDILSLLPLPNTTILVQIRPLDVESGFPADALESFSGQLATGMALSGSDSEFILFRTAEIQGNELGRDSEALTLLHEMMHVLDIWESPSLMLFTSREELLELALLRERAAQTANFSDGRLMREYERLRYVDYYRRPKDVRQTFLKKSETVEFSPDAVDYMAAAYSTVKFRDAFSSKGGAYQELYQAELERIERRFLDSDQEVSWLEFSEIFENNQEFPLTSLIVQESNKGHGISLENLNDPYNAAQPFYIAGSNFEKVGVTMVANDILHGATLKSALSRKQYNRLVEEAILSWQVAEKEFLAEKLAIFMFLKHVRGDNLDRFEGDPYLDYFRKVADVLGKRGVVMRISEETKARLLQAETLNVAV